MNNETTQYADSDPLNALFASARQMQPNLMDDNFTKSLMNSLPTINLVAQKESAKKGLSFDLIGAIIGLLMAYLFIDKDSLVNTFLGMVPETLVISPLLLIAAIGGVGLSSALAWWVVEDSRL